MTGQRRRPETLRWLIKRTRVSGGRRAGLSAWVVLRYRYGGIDPVTGERIRIILAVLGTEATLPRARSRAVLDCELIYDERSRP